MMRTRDILYPGSAPLGIISKAIFWVFVLYMLAASVATYSYYAHIKEGTSDFYPMLGKAFLRGHTYLDIQPSKELLALKDPYDPATNQPYVLWDASLYNNKYYLYFGPVPALIWAMVKYTTGIELDDMQLTLGLTCVGTISLILLLARICVHEHMAMYLGLLIAVVALVLGTWIPFMLRRPSFYEAAISGAYCFSALGLLSMWTGLVSEGRRSWVHLALASLSFGLAVGCRQTYVFNIILLAVGCIVLLRRLGLRAALPPILFLLVPWGLGMMGIMAYNFERFGSVFENGYHYQCTVYNLHTPGFLPFKADHIIPNAYLYLFRPLGFRHPFAFPFFNVEYYSRIPLPFNITAEAIEPLYGLFTNSPFSLWIFAAPYCWAKGHSMTDSTKAIIAGTMLYGFILLGLLLFFIFTTMRYSVDFSPWLMFVAGIQYLRVLNMAKTRTGSALLLTAGAIMALYGAFSGGLSGYCGQFLCSDIK